MLNVASSSFGTVVYCDKPTHAFHSPNNLLLSASERGYRSGLLCTPVTTPPVNILFRFPRPVALSLIVLKPNLGRHKVGCLSVFVLRDTVVKRKLNGCTLGATPEELVKRFDSASPLVSVKLNTHPPNTLISIRLSATQDIPSMSCLASAASILSFDNSRMRSDPLRVRVVLIRVTRVMEASCIPCMGAVEFWSLASDISSDPLAQKQLMDRKDVGSRDSDLEVNRKDASVGVPDELLDALTGDLMTDPIRLPSGTYVDRTSLHRFWSQRSAMNEGALQPLDPFTMSPLSEVDLKSDERLKQAISEYLDRRERLDSLCKKLDNWPLLGISLAEPYVSKFATSSDKRNAS